MFVWAGGEYLWIMKNNYVGRDGSEMVTDFRVRT